MEYLKNIDNQTYKEIFESSLKQIPLLDTEWTDFNYHDPGITLVQLFSWLKEIQQYYMSGVNEFHIEKYLSLLGVQPVETVGSSTCLSILTEKFLSLPIGSKFAAGNMTFESCDYEKIRPIKMINAKIKTPKGSFEVKEIIRKDNYFPKYIFGKELLEGSSLNISCNGEITEDLKLYFKMYLEYPVVRKPIREGKITFAQIKWEIEWEDKRIELEVISDDTNDFTQSGMVFLRSKTRISGDFNIIISLISNEYDIAPMLYYISPNPVKVCQKDTICKQVTYKNQSSLLPLETLFLDEKYVVWVKDKDGYVETGEYEEIKDGQGNRIGIRMFNPNIEWVRMILYDERRVNITKIKYTQIASSKQIYLEKKGLIKEDIKVHIRRYNQQGRMIWTEIFPFPDNEKPKEEDIGYRFEQAESKLCIGKYVEGILYEVTFEVAWITSFVISQGAKGNISLQTTDYKGFKVIPLDVAKGGETEEKASESLSHISLKLQSVKRAVTLEDYEQLVLQTEGLMIQKVKAYRETDEKYGNVVSIVVIPYSEDLKPTLSLLYQRCIRKNLEKYRQITTHIRILSPRYFGVWIYLVVYVGKESIDVKGEIEEYLKGYFNFDKRNVGQAVLYEDIYQGLEGLQNIKYVENFSMLLDDAVGCEVAKNGDILVCSEGFVYLKDVEIISKIAVVV